MAITYIVYSATAAQTDFAIPFPYIDTTHVKVLINGDATTDFTIANDTVTLTSGAASGDSVKVYRQTPGRSEGSTALLVDFQDGSVLSEADLDKVTQQLLYLAQEAEETGASSLPVDWDGNYIAGGKRIKNISELSNSVTDAASVGFVEGLALYGQGATVPQSWAKIGSDFTQVGVNPNITETLTLTSPTPTSDSEAVFLVTINGLVQRPTTDFTVTESGGVYTLTIIMGADPLNDGDIINIINMGVSRQINNMAQPLIPTAPTDVGFTVQGKDATQTGDMIVAEESDGTNVFSVGSNGVALSDSNVEVKVGNHSSDLANTEITGAKVEVGDVDTATATNYGVNAEVASSQGKIGLQSDSGGSTDTPAVEVTLGTTQKFAAKYDGSVDCGEIRSDGSSYIGDGTTGGAKTTIDHSTGNITSDGYLRLGDASVTVANAGDVACKEIWAEGLIASGNGYTAAGVTLSATGNVLANGYVKADFLQANSGTDGGLECQDSSVKGNFWFTTSGPALDYDAGGGTAGRGWIKALSTRILVGGTAGLDIGGEGSPGKITNVLCDSSSADTDAATKGYVDGEHEIVDLGVATGDGTGTLDFTAPAGDAFSNYHKIEMIVEDIKSVDANRQFAFSFYKDDGSGGYEYYNITSYPVTSAQNTPGSYALVDATSGTGMFIGSSSQDFNADEKTISGRIILTGIADSQTLMARAELFSANFSGTGSLWHIANTTWGPDAREAVTKIRMGFMASSTYYNVAAGTVRLIGYKA